MFGAASGSQSEYDCSSFVQAAARQAGLGDLPRSSRGQFALMRASGKVWLASSTRPPKLQPGDLIFFTGTFPHAHACPVSHVMIYAGQNLMIGAQPNGVGYFRFKLVAPQGNPGADHPSIRHKETVYAYARPSWRKVKYLIKTQSESFAQIR